MRRGWLVLLAIVLPVAALALALRLMEPSKRGENAEARKPPFDGGPPPNPRDEPPVDPLPRHPAAIPVEETDETPRLRRTGYEQSMNWTSADGLDDIPASAQIIAPQAAVPAYVSEGSETTELFRGYSPPGWVTFGVSEDGMVRMVDVDGGRFEGKLDGTRVTMRASRATSSFDLEFATLSSGRRHVSFRGGRHDARKLELEPVRRRSTR